MLWCDETIMTYQWPELYFEHSKRLTFLDFHFRINTTIQNRNAKSALLLKVFPKETGEMHYMYKYFNRSLHFAL